MSRPGLAAGRVSGDSGRSVLLVEAGPDYASVGAMPRDLLKPWVSWRDHDWGFSADARAGMGGRGVGRRSEQLIR